MKKRAPMNKRGNIILDLAVFMVILFGLAITFVILHNVWGEVAGEVLTDSDLNHTELNQSYTNVGGYMDSLSYIFLFVIIGMMIYLIISASFIDTHPGYFIIGIFALIVLVIIGAGLANGFYAFWEDPVFAGEVATLGLMSKVMIYFPIFLLITGALVFVFLYARRGT